MQDYWEEQGDDAEVVDFEEWDEEFGEQTPRARLGELKGMLAAQLDDAGASGSLSSVFLTLNILPLGFK